MPQWTCPCRGPCAHVHEFLRVAVPALGPELLQRCSRFQLPQACTWLSEMCWFSLTTAVRIWEFLLLSVLISTWFYQALGFLPVWRVWNKFNLNSYNYHRWKLYFIQKRARTERVPSSWQISGLRPPTSVLSTFLSFFPASRFNDAIDFIITEGETTTFWIVCRKI